MRPPAERLAAHDEWIVRKRDPGCAVPRNVIRAPTQANRQKGQHHEDLCLPAEMLRRGSRETFFACRAAINKAFPRITEWDEGKRGKRGARRKSQEHGTEALRPQRPKPRSGV